jgi:hypothetical protein
MMPHFNEDIQLKNESPLLANATTKENIFLLVVFGWAGLPIILPNLLGTLRSRDNSWTWIVVSLFIIGFCLFYGYDNFYLKVATSLSTIALLVFFDCHQKKFIKNVIIHLMNGGVVGVIVYFLVMKLYPESFPPLWKKVSPALDEAFDMMFLCLIFQNFGYYVIGGLLFPPNSAFVRWTNSSKNLFNLSFIDNDIRQLKLFVILSSFGLITRVWNLILGKTYYTDGSGIPFLINSFLSQFDRLYMVAWLYGCWFWFQKGTKNNTLTWLTIILTLIELAYQILSGSKGRFFNLVLIPLASLLIMTRQRASAFIVFLVTGVSIFSWLFIYPILVIYRNVLSAASTVDDPIATIGKAYLTVSTYSIEKYIEIILTPLTASGIAELVLSITSIIYYHVTQDGNLIWPRLFLFWVPRFLWDDKPTNLSTNLIGRLSHRLGQEDFSTSVLNTSPGELYLYFGLMGSCLMILFGIVLRLMNETTSPFKFYSPFRIAILISFLPLLQNVWLVSFESNLTGIVMRFGILYLVLILIKRII